MTKDVYFEMLEQLGSEPIDSEIPIEMEDLPSQAQVAFKIYYLLQDKWDYMSGNYIGKDYGELTSALKIYNVATEDAQLVYELLHVIDNIRSKQIADSKPRKPPN